MEQITKTITAHSSATSATQEQTRKKELMKLRKKGERGFTLIELLFALAVLGAIAVTGGSQAPHQSGGGAQSSVQWSGSGGAGRR